MTRALLSCLFPRPQRPAQHLFRNASTSQARTLSHCKNNQLPHKEPVNGPHLSFEQGDNDIVPGSHVTRVAQRYRIGYPKQLRRLHAKLPPGLYCLYSTSHIFDRIDMKYLDSHEHPYAGSVLERYIEWTSGPRPLWWSFIAYNGAPVVCSHAKRYMNRGIQLALEEFGYDRFGKKLSGAGMEQQTDDLYGTLRIFCSQPQDFCREKFPDILLMAKEIVAVVEKRLAIKPSNQSTKPEPQVRHNGRADSHSKPLLRRNSNASSTSYRPANAEVRHEHNNARHNGQADSHYNPRLRRNSNGSPISHKPPSAEVWHNRQADSHYSPTLRRD